MNDSNAAFFMFAIRIGERVTLAAIVVLISVVVCVGFWRSAQKIDFSLGRDGTSGSASVLLATPVLALLALIGFAWVSFSNPIAISVPLDQIVSVNSELPPAPVAHLSGIVPAGQPMASVDATDRERVQEQIRHLNCVTSTPDLSRAPQTDDWIVQIKLTLLKAVWLSEWGSFQNFESWANKATLDEPNPLTKAIFREVHSRCSHGLDVQ